MTITVLQSICSYYYSRRFCAFDFNLFVLFFFTIIISPSRNNVTSDFDIRTRLLFIVFINALCSLTRIAQSRIDILLFV